MWMTNFSQIVIALRNLDSRASCFTDFEEAFNSTRKTYMHAIFHLLFQRKILQQFEIQREIC